jgi:hypothetical protein
LPGFNEIDYAEQACVNRRTLNDLANEFRALREANLYLYRSITDAQSLNMGIASNHPVSVRALLYITAGHEMHHINILRERYL